MMASKLLKLCLPFCVTLSLQSVSVTSEANGTFTLCTKNRKVSCTDDNDAKQCLFTLLCKNNYIIRPVVGDVTMQRKNYMPAHICILQVGLLVHDFRLHM